MQKNNTKMSFAVDASSIQLKKMLNSEYLELSMRAISTANPNRNNSWFTKESLEKSKGTFVNKPILGYFENGDFVSHNGDWNHDSETQMDYWDTLGKKGERILGLIRESDQIKIEEDSSGLSWIVFSCAIWVQYSFKQVKRLIKDAIRAQKTGESTKNISVEVDITDEEILDNGVMKINAFNLVGVTILGTRDGKKVEPGIEDAELSLVEFIGHDVYAKQEQSLRLAYEKLDNSISQKEESQVSKKKIETEEVSTQPVASEQNPTEKTTTEQLEQKLEVCPDCGKEPCECESKCHEDGCGEEPVEPQKEEEKQDHLEEEPSEEKELQEESKCEESEEEPVAEQKYEEEKKEEEKVQCNEEDDDEEHDDDDEEEDGCGCGHCEEKEHCEEKVETQSQLENKEEDKDLKEEYELLQKENEDLKLELNTLKEEFEKIKSERDSYQHQEFLSQATALISSAKLDEETSKKFIEQCEKAEINTLEDLKVKVALNVFDSNVAINSKTTLQVPINKPDTTTAFNKEQNKSKKSDYWSVLHDYTK